MSETQQSDEAAERSASLHRGEAPAPAAEKHPILDCGWDKPSGLRVVHELRAEVAALRRANRALVDALELSVETISRASGKAAR